MDRNRIIRIASIISIVGNAILALLKISVGIMAGSLSVLADGLDSLTDIFISFITLFVSVIITHPPDREHPYGHYRAETIATSVLAFIIFFIGGQLVLTTADRMINQTEISMPGMPAVYVTVFSIAGKLVLSWSQYRLGKKADSDLLLANGKNMQNDVITSIGVLVGLGCVFFFQMPIIDRILAIIIGLWIMITAVRIFVGTLTELMEGEVNHDLYDCIFETIKKIDGVGNPHRVRIKKLGIHYVIDMDIEVDGSLTVSEAHRRCVMVEERLRAALPSIYDIMIHIEPLGNYEAQERYGLTESDIR